MLSFTICNKLFFDVFTYERLTDAHTDVAQTEVAVY